MFKEILKYEKGVLSGKIPSGNLLRLAVERNVRDMANSKKKSFPYEFDIKSAERIIKFCELCHHWKGAKARTPIILEPNQKWRLALKYGWKEKGTGRRRFRKFYEEVARKNAKTTEKALEAIYHMVIDGGIGSCVVAAATKADQAKIVVNDAGKIIEATPVLKNRGFRLFKMKGKVYEIHYPPTEGSMFAIGRDSDNQDGLDPSMGIIDEYHAHKDDGILRVIKSGMQARPEPMLSIITTAGYDMEGPCYKSERKNAIDILEGEKNDESYFISIYSPDREDEERLKQIDANKLSSHEKELKNIFFKSNPNLGASVLLQNLLSDYLDALNKGSSTMVGFLTKNANMWVDAPESWIESEVWAQNTIYNDLKMWPTNSEPFGKSKYLKDYRIVNPQYIEEQLAGRDCFGGLDLSSSLDFSAYVLAFTPDDDGRIPIVPYVWTTEKNLKKLDGRQFYDWENHGFLFVGKGSKINHNEIWDKIVETTEQFNVIQVAYDPHLAQHTIVQRATESDEHYELLAGFGQRITNVSYPTKYIEATCHSYDSEDDIIGFEHYNNPVLSWMLKNVEINRDRNGNIGISRRDQKKKVDAFAALVCAIASMLSFEEQEGGTILFVTDTGS